MKRPGFVLEKGGFGFEPTALTGKAPESTDA